MMKCYAGGMIMSTVLSSSVYLMGYGITLDVDGIFGIGSCEALARPKSSGGQGKDQMLQGPVRDWRLRDSIRDHFIFYSAISDYFCG